MKTIVGGRGSGKTTELIKTAYDTGAAILCLTRCETGFIKTKAKEMGLHAERLKVFTVDDMVSGRMRGKHFNGIIIDNGEYVLQNLISNYLQIDSKDFLIQYVTPSRVLPGRITNGSDYD